MIGPDRRQHAQLLQPENGREEDVIERPAQKSPIGVEGRVEAAADAGIEETADLLEQAGRAGQGNVVQVARDARRFANHPILESETASAVEENLSLTIAVAQPGQLPYIPLNQLKPSLL